MPCDYSKYPEDWPEIRREILERAENKCELCGAGNGKPHWKTRSKVILTIAHLDQDIENNAKYNLRALCQRCHNIIDLPYRIKRRKEKERMRIENPIRTQDLLIKRLGEEISEGVRRYITKNNVSKEEFEINVMVIESENPYELKVITKINKREGSKPKEKMRKEGGEENA